MRKKTNRFQVVHLYCHLYIRLLVLTQQSHTVVYWLLSPICPTLKCTYLYSQTMTHTQQIGKSTFHNVSSYLFTSHNSRLIWFITHILVDVLFYPMQFFPLSQRDLVLYRELLPSIPKRSCIIPKGAAIY